MSVAKPVAVDDYQVFLSFRGPDTRYDFTDVLYEHMAVRVGIRVFRDVEEIGVGQKIDVILQAIENSEICVPILSENFASSAWCLREVEKMVELEKKVIPIFYKISPNDVNCNTDLYTRAMAGHDAKYGKEQVEKWKTALKKIAKFTGALVSADTRYTEFCKKFVDEVLSKLRPRKRLNTDHLVGMDSAIDSVMSLLDIESPDVRCIGIQGMGGIGKTTLANAYVAEFCKSFTTKVISTLEKSNLADEYDVFLSFRGADVRQGFISVLYDYLVRAGICVFKEDDHFFPDDYISNILLEAIHRSRICIPIFSKNYASSTWCLREVTKMVELNKEIIPIFYDVEPDDVKLKTPVYKEAIDRHRHDGMEVKHWADALKTASKIKGMLVHGKSITGCCKRFTTIVLSMVTPRKRYDTGGLVGMNKQVDQAMALLDKDPLDVRFIGIHGMGGIGKTTLCKFIFDQLSANFDHRAFIEDIRECLGRHGLDHLEQQLREKLDPKYIINSNLSRSIKERFHGRKVLIVLDDVDKQEQIEKLAGDPTWFGLGSRIIITTRNIDVLKNYKRVDEGSRFTMEMEMLDTKQALELFCKYAFGNDAPAPTFEHLSREVVSTAGGLPLTLTVLGSRLYNKDERVWEEVIVRSKEVPPREVLDRLKISYDALEDYMKEVFLDIACFFIGEEMSNASYMWRTCKLSPHMALATLHSMSLVKTTNDNKIWMHDQLRDLGRNIAQQQSFHLRERSRLRVQEEAMSVLTSKENKENIIAIRLEEPCNPYNWKHKHFLSLVNLRYLQLKGSNFLMNFEGLLPNLIQLSWHSFPRDINDIKLPLTNLVVLDLSCSFIDENWSGWRQIQTAKKLKVLDLTSCQNLKTTPEFSEHMPLERLILKACRNLVSLHGSITDLKQLSHLNLEECCLLRELPDVVRSLNTLTEMPIVGSGLNLSLS